MRNINIIKALRKLPDENAVKNEPCFAALQSAIEAAQGRARVRCIDAYDVIKALAKIERFFDIPRTALAGSTVKIDVNSEIFPAAYKFAPVSTQITAECDGKSWYVTDIHRRIVQVKHVYADLSDTAQREILYRCRHFDI